MATSGATPIGFDDRGTGPATVLLHPFPLTRTTWAGLADALAARRRVIAVDARGFGDTPLGGSSFSIADLADDVAALLDRLAVPRATILGVSMGGYAALAFAARHRERLSALVLADTRAAADSAETRAARAAALAAVDAGPAAYLAASLPRLLAPNAPPALVAHLRARAETRAASLRAGIEALRDRPDRTGELGAIACPTLVVCGTEDQVTPAAEMQQIAAAISGARFVPIADAGHLSHVEAPGAFLHAVTSFLDATAEARPS